MKKMIILFLLIPMITLAQLEVSYQNIPAKEGRYSSYLTKNGAVVSLKDSIIIGLPTGPDGFRFITTGWESEDNFLSGRIVIIEGIRTFKRNWLRKKVFLRFRGNGVILPSYIDYEMALKSGEIEPPE